MIYVCIGELIYTNNQMQTIHTVKQWICTNWQERAHSGERSALCIWVHGQSDVCIGHVAFMASRAYLLRFVEQCRAAGKEVSLCFHQEVPPPPTINQSCQCGAVHSPPHCYNIWETDGGAVLSLIWPQHASGGSTMASHPPYEASDHIFGWSINWLLV